MIGSASYEAHDFTSTTSGGKTVSVCNDCGYTKETVQTYTVSYNANGGTDAFFIIYRNLLKWHSVYSTNQA